MDSHERQPEVLPDTALRQALEAAPDGVLIVDHGGTILYANPTLEAMFAYDAGELTGRPVEVLVPDGVRPAHTANRDDYVNHPRTRPMGSGLDLRGRRKDGREVPVEISLSPVPGTPPLVVAHDRLRTTRPLRWADRRRHARRRPGRAPPDAP